MNRNLNEAIFDIAKVEAIMFAFENTYLEPVSYTHLTLPTTSRV